MFSLASNPRLNPLLTNLKVHRALITTVIFDLDGLLADTEPLHCQAYRDALLAEGIPLTEAEYCEHWVRSGKGIADWLAERGFTHDPLALRRLKSRRYLDLLACELRPMPGALELLNRLHGRKKLGLASSSYRDAVDGVLDGLGVARYFQAIVSGLDVARVKPDPEIFVAAAQQLDSSPSECLVIEDAEKGVIAAHRAGMHCIAVPNEYTRHHDFSKATRVCASLDDISLEFIASIQVNPIR
jgi:HAD superfamily hydrolase (TIGR01509 family)